MKNFSLLLLAFIATQANGKLICPDNSNFCQIVTDFDKELTWEKSKPIGSNQEYEEQDYGMSLQKDGDVLLTGCVLSSMGQKYQKQTLKDISDKVKELAKEIRNPDSNLYEIAKSVGRIDKIHSSEIITDVAAVGISIQQEGMGTATLVTWDNMPPEMKGRVILTCLHNHNYFLAATNPKAIKRNNDNFYWVNKLKDESTDHDTYKMLKCKDVYFTLDESNDKINIRGYGTTDMSIKVSHCYYASKSKYANNDIAIFILEKPITTVKPIEIFKTNLPNITLQKDDQVIGVGYGRSSAAHETEGTRFLDGWNIKKKIQAICNIHTNKQRIGIDNDIGNGDSGSLIFAILDEEIPEGTEHQNKLEAVAIATGSENPMLYPHEEWMKAAVKNFADEEKTKQQLH